MKRGIVSFVGKAVGQPDDIRRVKRGGKRVLIHEILTLQILITAAIGALAIAGLYWGVSVRSGSWPKASTRSMAR